MPKKYLKVISKKVKGVENNSAPFKVGGAVSYLFKRNCAALSISNTTQKFLNVFMQHFVQIIFPKIVHFYLLLFMKNFHII